MLRLLILTIFLVGFGYTLYIIYNFAVKWGWNRINLNTERNNLLQALKKYRNHLSRLDSDELESVNNKIKVIKSNDYPQIEKMGLCFNLNGDSVVAFAVRPYGPMSSISLACTRDNIYTFIKKNRETKVYIDDTEVGIVYADGSLYSPNQKLLAKMDNSRSAYESTVYIYGKKVGYLFPLYNYTGKSDKAFAVHERLEKDEYELFLALSLLKISNSEL